MNIASQVISIFLKEVGRPNQEYLLLRRFRGQFGVGGRELEYYRDVVIPHKIAVYHAGIELIDLAKNYHDFKNRRLIDHDISKLSRAEEAYAKMDFNKIDNNSEKQLRKFSLAWHHHKHCNSHHPEHWFTINKSGDVSVLPMPHDDVLEMVIDWMGAVTYGQSFEDFLNENLGNFVFHTDTAKYLQEILDRIGYDTKSSKSTFNNAKILR